MEMDIVRCMGYYDRKRFFLCQKWSFLRSYAIIVIIAIFVQILHFGIKPLNTQKTDFFPEGCDIL